MVLIENENLTVSIGGVNVGSPIKPTILRTISCFNAHCSLYFIRCFLLPPPECLYIFDKHLCHVEKKIKMYYYGNGRVISEEDFSLKLFRIKLLNYLPSQKITTFDTARKV